MQKQPKGALWLASSGALMGAVFGVITYQGTGRLALALVIGGASTGLLALSSFIAAWRSYDPSPPPVQLTASDRRRRLLEFLSTAVLFYLAVVAIAVFPAFRGPIGLSVFLGLVLARITAQILLTRVAR